VSDAGMKSLAALVNLRELDLSRMEITAKGLAPLSAMTKLRRLNLWGCERVDDKAVESLGPLEILDLSDTGVTDKALDRLEAMTSLKKLFVGGRVTPARVERFRKARPDCRVIWMPKYKEVKSEEDTRLTG